MGGEVMKADQLDKARNPLLSGAMEAIQRAAQRARKEALRTHTAIVIARGERIERIEWNQLSDSAAEYREPSQPPSDEKN